MASSVQHVQWAGLLLLGSFPCQIGFLSAGAYVTLRRCCAVQCACSTRIVMPALVMRASDCPVLHAVISSTVPLLTSHMTPPALIAHCACIPSHTMHVKASYKIWLLEISWCHLGNSSVHHPTSCCTVSAQPWRKGICVPQGRARPAIVAVAPC